MDFIKTQANIKGFVEAVVTEYKPQKIVLYGSRVKGKNNEESDIDIAIIVNKVEGSLLDKEARLYRIRRNYDVNIEPILLENSNDESGFLEHILSYGSILYDEASQ